MGGLNKAGGGRQLSLTAVPTPDTHTDRQTDRQTYAFAKICCAWFYRAVIAWF